MTLVHKPVMVGEIVNLLVNKKSLGKAKYIDATLGAGGHAKELLCSGGDVLGIDEDQSMIEIARKTLEMACLRRQACPASNSVRGDYELVHGNFRDIDQIAKTHDYDSVDGIIFDLGVSSAHYKNNRGFSFQDENSNLDMRLNVDVQKVTASDLVNSLREDQLHELFEVTLDYKEARRLSRTIVRKRDEKRIITVGDFLQSTNHIIKKSKPFLALRIAVNSEMESVSMALPKAISLLKTGGKLAVISFHSGEDKLVKQIFKKYKNKGLRIKPTEEEIRDNPRSRSAILRIYEK